MQTSTPVGSPVRRKLSMRQKVLEIEQDEDDLESELQTRRLEAINKSTEQKRRSIAAPLLAGLNTAQLAKHCQDCIKLSTENKINTKNAFNFLLIDFMAAMTKKNDSEINKNFQVAGCTLDASVKIYGYRVDAVHGEATKLASGFFRKELQEALEGDEEGDDPVEVKKKPKKKKRKMTVVPAASLNAKSELETLLDAPPKKTLLSRNSDGSSLLTRIPKYSDGCVLMVDADVPCWPFGDNEILVPKFEIKENCDATAAMELFQDIPVHTGDKICRIASEIEFGGEVEIDDDMSLDCSQRSAFQFDVNASVADADFEESVVAPPRLAVPCGGYDSGDEIALPEEASRRVTSTSILDMKRRLSVHNSEYSMFDEKVLKAWAGPTYWKVRPSRESHGENKENEGAPLAAATKRTRRGKVKEVAELFQVSKDVLDRHLELSMKCQLAKSTLCSWKPASVTLSEDYKYNPQHLFTLFHLPLKVIQPQDEKSPIEGDGDSDMNEDEGGVAEELEYCSMVVDEEPSFGEPANSSVQEVATWDAENMVAVPHKVAKISVGGLRRRNHVDMKHLKKCVWEVVSEEDTLNFKDLGTVCPPRMPKNIASCMSTPLLFNALLHLTNEQSLVLRQTDKRGDFQISKPPKK